MTSNQTDPGADLGHFEASSEKLESIVKALESDDIGLEVSLQAFKEGIVLIRGLQEALRNAEQHVSILLQSDGEVVSIRNDKKGGED